MKRHAVIVTKEDGDSQTDGAWCWTEIADSEHHRSDPRYGLLVFQQAARKRRCGIRCFMNQVCSEILSSDHPPIVPDRGRARAYRDSGGAEEVRSPGPALSATEESGSTSQTTRMPK